MLDLVKKIIEMPHVERYRKYLVGLALALLFLHLVAFVLPLVGPDSSAKVKHIVDFSYNLHGVTGALLLIVILGAAIRALTDADQRARSEAYDFIRRTLAEWFAAQSSKDESKAFVDEVASQAYTDFKVVGAERLIDLPDREITRLFCNDVHFEFTFYPTKLIYGIHFESAFPELNESMCAEIRAALRMKEESGFAVDHQIPKKPSWIFLVRTVEISGNFEQAIPTVMTHARHFVELVYHNYNTIYNSTMAGHFRMLYLERKQGHKLDIRPAP